MKPLFLGMGFVFIILAAMTLKPVPMVSEKECLSQVGIVSEVFEGGTLDVVIRLKDNDERFYINRGLERGLDLVTIKSDLIGHEVTLKYPDHWTPLDPFNRTHHLSKVVLGDKVIFTEIN